MVKKSGKCLPVLPVCGTVVDMETAQAAIKTMRKARGWTIAELARRAGCDSSYLWRVEAGERTPSPYFLAHLSSVLSETEDAA